jgi:hypothetical protein
MDQPGSIEGHLRQSAKSPNMNLQSMFKAIEQKQHLVRSYILPLTTLAQHQRALMIDCAAAVCSFQLVMHLYEDGG